MASDLGLHCLPVCPKRDARHKGLMCVFLLATNSSYDCPRFIPLVGAGGQNLRPCYSKQLMFVTRFL